MKKLKHVLKWSLIILAAYFIVNFVLTERSVDKSIVYWTYVIQQAVQGGGEKDSAALDEATVLYVVDGDTIVVDNNGNEEKIRMIGVNTPESVHSDESKNTPEGKEASDFTKTQLKEGMTVYLQYDEEKEDQYGRILAYIWLTDDCDLQNYDDFCKYNYGAVLLQNTHCEAVYYEPNGMYKDWYEKLDTTR